MSNGCEEEGKGGDGGGGSGGSRFSQFFRQESPSPKPLQSQESQHSTTQDEMFNSMINGWSSINDKSQVLFLSDGICTFPITSRQEQDEIIDLINRL